MSHTHTQIKLWFQKETKLILIQGENCEHSQTSQTSCKVRKNQVTILLKISQQSLGVNFTDHEFNLMNYIVAINTVWWLNPAIWWHEKTCTVRLLRPCPCKKRPKIRIFTIKTVGEIHPWVKQEGYTQQSCTNTEHHWVSTDNNKTQWLGSGSFNSSAK